MLLGIVAEQAWEQKKAAGTLKPAIADVNCDVDVDLAPAPAAPPPRTRASDWILSGLALGEIAALTYFKLRSKFKRVIS